jgi:hypothetical protein
LNAYVNIVSIIQDTNNNANNTINLIKYSLTLGETLSFTFSEKANAAKIFENFIDSRTASIRFIELITAYGRINVKTSNNAFTP